MTPYDATFEGLHILFNKENVENTLGEVISKAGLKQLRIAETEKYAHVTFFFNGGREAQFEGESRILVPSPKVATYDLQPEMSAPEVAEKLVEQLNAKSADFVCLNFANGDMVGHTGVYAAIQKAVATVDRCVEKGCDCRSGQWLRCIDYCRSRKCRQCCQSRRYSEYGSFAESGALHLGDRRKGKGFE